ncbi:MAG: transglutaminase family protein [Candidatus Hermodarchaeota archaeon]
MKNKYTFVLFCLLLFPSINSIGIPIVSPYIMTTEPTLSLPVNGVSHYNITGSVKYQVVINFSLTSTSGTNNYYFKFARINNRTPTSPLTNNTPPYQESSLIYNSISGKTPYEIAMNQNDKFNNTYDWYNVTLNTGQTTYFDQKYNVTLNAIRFQDIDNSSIGPYNPSDIIFDLYGNHTEPYYETDEPSLYYLTKSIVLPTDNPVEKAEKICNWVANNIVYNGFLPPQEKGALWAYTNLQGDCSEYSSLMVTLLRIQGIPARKVTGFLISNNPSLRPAVGNVWNFNSNEGSSNILGHAWVEYYVPNIGWIACDPTWHSGVNYFNRIDFLRFNLNVGANFFFPPSFTVSEFSNPIIGYTGPYQYDYDITITVLGTELPPLTEFPIYIAIFIIVGFVAVIGVIFLLLTKGRKKVVNNYDY